MLLLVHIGNPKMSFPLLALVFLCINPFVSSSNMLRDPRTLVQKEKKRPPMYTFFQMKRISTGGRLDTNGKHEEMLETWKKSWYTRGFDPIVLNLEDAKKHPAFEHYSSKFEKLTSDDAFIFGGSYDYMCLMRWLAMAAQGVDAFMSDYDTYPFHIRADYGYNLPNGGNFTAYQIMVPCLMSASASEWERLARLVIDNVLEKFEADGTRGVYSDMFALADVYNKSPVHDRAFISENRVSGYPYIDKDNIDCEGTKDTLALHLAHHSTKTARKRRLLPENVNDNQRYKFYFMMMKDWVEQCSPNRAAETTSMVTDQEKATWRTKLQTEGYVITKITFDDKEMMEDIYTILEIRKPVKRTQVRAFIVEQQQEAAGECSTSCMFVCC